MNESKKICDLIALANYAGGRLDLVQASGGNISVKMNHNEILVKKSGIAMAEISSEIECSRLNLEKIIFFLNNFSDFNNSSKIVKEQSANNMLKEANLTPGARPSIEAYMHAITPFTYTLHLHALSVNHIMILNKMNDYIQQFFPEAVCINYATPGIELAIEVKNATQKYYAGKFHHAKIIFLKNHGHIISADSYEDVININEYILSKIENTLKLDYSRYRLATKIANLFYEITNENCIALLCEDKHVHHILFNERKIDFIPITTPDAFVFGGFKPLRIVDLSSKEIINYFKHFGIYPKIIIYQNHIYFINKNVKKAREMEEVFKFHLLSLTTADNQIDSLPIEELYYLSNWEAEKYRQQQ